MSLPLRVSVKPNEPVGLVHFDAHTDTSDAAYGTHYNNGTCFRRAVEEGLIDPKRTIQIGIRSNLFREDDMALAYTSGIRVITMDEFDGLGREGVIREIRNTVDSTPTYVTFDIDGLDPVHCPGTGAPEPGGLSTRDAQVILRRLRSLDLIGGDVCEVSPPLDPTGRGAGALLGHQAALRRACDSAARQRISNMMLAAFTAVWPAAARYCSTAITESSSTEMMVSSSASVSTSEK